MVVRKKASANKAKKVLEGRTKKVAITEGKKEVAEVSIPATKEPVMDGPLPTAVKQKQPPEGYVTISSGLGVTLNMDNYQSARIDVHIIRNVKDDEKVIKDAFGEMHEMVLEEIETQSEAVFDLVEE